MIVQCPNCRTKYNFDESKFKDQIKVRCTRCRHVFKISTLSDEDDFFEDFSLGAKSRDRGEAPEKPQWDPDDMNVDIEPAPAKPADRRKQVKTAVMAGAALLGVFLIIFFGATRFGNNFNVPFFTAEEEKISQKTEFSEEDVKDISLENIRQYFVTNDKIGQLFVIEGQAVNNFQTPKSMIKLRASLYDAQGQVVVEQDFLCGNLASLFQLQVSSQEELESTLQSRLGILTTNKHVEPGSYTPFMAVFFNPPETVQEFGLEVIEAHDPVQ